MITEHTVVTQIVLKDVTLLSKSKQNKGRQTAARDLKGGKTMAKIEINEVMNVLEAAIGETECVIPSQVLESAVEYLKEYEDLKSVESWRKFPESMGR